MQEFMQTWLASRLVGVGGDEDLQLPVDFFGLPLQTVVDICAGIVHNLSLMNSVLSQPLSYSALTRLGRLDSLCITRFRRSGLPGLAALLHCIEIRSLTFHTTGASGELCDALREIHTALGTAPSALSLCELHFKECAFDDACAHALAMVVESCWWLRGLSLDVSSTDVDGGGSRWQRSGWGALASALHRCRNLGTLRICGSSAGQALPVVSAVFKSDARTLRTLSLDDCLGTCEDAVRLCTAAMGSGCHAHLQVLELAGCPCADAGGVALGIFVGQCSWLRTVCLTELRLLPGGMEAILTGLAANLQLHRTLAVLRLDDNRGSICARAQALLAQVVSQCVHLRHLSVAHCFQATEVSGGTPLLDGLAASLRDAPSLELLRLDGCALGLHGCLTLASVLGSGARALRCISLAANGITPSAASALAEALEVRMTARLRQLDLRANPLGNRVHEVGTAL